VNQLVDDGKDLEEFGEDDAFEGLPTTIF